MDSRRKQQTIHTGTCNINTQTEGTKAEQENEEQRHNNEQGTEEEIKNIHVHVSASVSVSSTLFTKQRSAINHESSRTQPKLEGLDWCDTSVL